MHSSCHSSTENSCFFFFFFFSLRRKGRCHFLFCFRSQSLPSVQMWHGHTQAKVFRCSITQIRKEYTKKTQCIIPWQVFNIFTYSNLWLPATKLAINPEEPCLQNWVTHQYTVSLLKIPVFTLIHKVFAYKHRSSHK